MAKRYLVTIALEVHAKSAAQAKKISEESILEWMNDRLPEADLAYNARLVAVGTEPLPKNEDE